ncbi:MAG: alpha-amylase family glycosyl hydrolase [Luteolibacter sp.]
MTEKPQLVIDDPWLEPHQPAIERRMRQFSETLANIEASSGTLADYARMHETTGVLFNKTGQQWIVREWAPAAKAVSLIGDFNQWDRLTHPLTQVSDGFWELKLPASTLEHGQKVKLHIHGADDSRLDRIPATTRRAVQDSETHDFCGQIWNPPEPYVWQHSFDPSTLTAPLIYEAHVGMAGEEPRLHTYREFTEQTLPRIARLGYNTIQLMAVQEHPYYGSFGYHVSSFFAPCSRFGTPEDLKQLIDAAHGLGIAVLLDIVHSHAVKNMAEGLNNFDGSGHQYFHDGPLGDHPAWDSKCFDYGRPEVRQFLLSNVRYWLEEFHFDGFRFDGVTSMLYHSRGMKAFGSYDDYFGDDADEQAILYLKLANRLIQETKPGAIVVAEDMSGMPGLCRPISEGGVGFGYRLAMGIPDHWIKLLKHTRDEDWDIGELWGVLSNRRHGEKTIAYAESHDQALVGDKTLAFWLMDQEMYWHMAKDDPSPVVERGIALHKLIRLATLTIGGEGWLNFIGNEFGHPEWLDFPREGNGWSYHYCRRQWSLVDNPDLKYHWLSEFDHQLVETARKLDLLNSAPARLLHLDMGQQVLIFERAGAIVVLNFSTDQSIFGYEFHAPAGTYQITLDTDLTNTGGHARLDHSVEYPVNENGIMKIYTPARTGMIFTKI